MVDQSWRQCFELEVAHAVASDNHSRSLTVEFVNNALQGLRRRIQVVAVKLYGKASASFVVDSYVPASANTEVGACRHDMNESFVFLGNVVEYLECAVGRVVVHNYYVVLESCLLAECRFYGVCHGFCTVVHGYDNRSLTAEVLLAEVGFSVVRSVYRCTNLLKVACGSLLHFHLHLTVTRVDIVKLSFAALAEVGFNLRVKIFVEVEYLCLATDVQAQVVQSGILIVGFLLFGGIVVQKRRAYEYELSEVEVVAYATLLIVDGRMLLYLSVLLYIAVGVHHSGTAVSSHTQHTVKGVLSQIHGCGFEVQQYIFGIGIGFDVEQRLSGCEAVSIDDGDVVDAFVAVDTLVYMAAAVHQQVNMLYCLALS